MSYSAEHVYCRRPVYLKCVTGIIHVCNCLVEMRFIVFDLLNKVRFKSMSLKHAIVNFDD